MDILNKELKGEEDKIQKENETKLEEIKTLNEEIQTQKAVERSCSSTC